MFTVSHIAPPTRPCLQRYKQQAGAGGQRGSSLCSKSVSYFEHPCNTNTSSGWLGHVGHVSHVQALKGPDCTPLAPVGASEGFEPWSTLIALMQISYPPTTVEAASRGSCAQHSCRSDPILDRTAHLGGWHHPATNNSSTTGAWV